MNSLGNKGNNISNKNKTRNVDIEDKNMKSFNNTGNNNDNRRNNIEKTRSIKGSFFLFPSLISPIHHIIQQIVNNNKKENYHISSNSISEDDLATGEYDPRVIDSIYRKYSDIWGCKYCNWKGDKWFMMKHPCKILSKLK